MVAKTGSILRIRITPRDRLQDQVLEVLSRNVKAGDSNAANERLSDLGALVTSCDLASGTQLQRRLANKKDALARYFDSRLSAKIRAALREKLQLHLISIRGVEPTPEKQISTPYGLPKRVKASDAAKKLVRILQRPVRRGSNLRYRLVYELFMNLDLVDAARLREKLKIRNDSLRTMMFNKLSESSASWLIEEVLDKSAQGLSVEELPENLSAEQIDRRLRKVNLVLDASTGARLSREQKIFKRELYEEASQRGEAISLANENRLKDIELENEYPGLSARKIRRVMEVAEENKRWLRWINEPSEKTALSKFLVQLKQLRTISNSQSDFIVVLGTWATMMRSSNFPNKTGSYMDVWARYLNRYGFPIEHAYKQKLNEKGFIWIQAVLTPGPIEFIVELQRNGELFKLKNFKAAALGGVDAFVAVGKGIVALADLDTYIQIKNDFAEHGVDIIHVFDYETIDLFRSQLERDFKAFSMLDETQQARTASFVLTSAVIDGKLPDASVAVGKKALAAKRRLDGSDVSVDPIPRATAKKAEYNIHGKRYLKGRQLQSAFRKWTLRNVRSDHPLHFLFKFDKNGNAIDFLGRKRTDPHDVQFEDLLSVDAGHLQSRRVLKDHGFIENEFVMIELRWENQARSKSVEKPDVPGMGFKNKPAIDIQGIPVDVETVKVWVKYNLLNKKWLNAKQSHGWNNDP